MLRRTLVRTLWMGGVGQQLHTTGLVGPAEAQLINIQENIAVHGTMDRDALTGPLVLKPQCTRWSVNLRGDIYDELLKLPLRYALHPFDKLHEHTQRSNVGYAPPLGPADPVDTLPFFIHRNTKGKFEIKVTSIAPSHNDPTLYLSIYLIEGDLFRFEEELIKLFPLKKTFVRQHKVVVFNAGRDAVGIIKHWLYGLGF
jgi:hypothetical protein